MTCEVYCLHRRCFDRQLLMLFRGRCLQESLGNVSKMDPKFCAGFMLKVTNDKTSFQVLVLLSVDL